VVHRDVKPSNILVDAEGQPHVTDFGLAKRDADEARLTAEGDVLGTPAYMSPEQARGEAHRVDGRTDVYSLGAVLYELLTGGPPFRGNPRMLLRQVLEEDPRPPRQFDDRTPRDLETICLKALAKEPAGRYATAAELAADLRRFLRGEAVQARPTSRVVKLARWCRRHPAKAGLVLALVLGLAGTAWQWHRAAANLAEADRQRRRAEENFGQAWRVVTGFAHLGLDRVHADQPGRLAVQRELAEKALKYYEDVLGRQQADPAQLVDVARVYVLAARLYSHYLPGQRDKALAAWRKALLLCEGLVPDQPQSVEFQTARAEAHFELSRLQPTPRRQEQALRAVAQTCAFLERLPPGRLDNQTCFDLYQTYFWMGILHHHRDRPAQSLECHRQALAVAERLVREPAASPYFQVTLARSRYHVARAYAQLQRPREAIRFYQDSAALWEQLAAAHPQTAAYRRDLAACFHNLGNLSCDTGRPADAVAYYRKALSLREELCRQHPADPIYRTDRDGTRHNLAEVLGQCVVGWSAP
jgi:tetratricopeptide (TPR) repeat protein